jgi:regulator of protease activity HflC (stomatin/prohibitin superfamily)
MKLIKVLSFLVILAIAGSWLIFNLMTIYIPIGIVGVRTQQYAFLGKKGVVQEDFGPGWHWDRGPIDTWVVFDSTVQTLEMTRDPKQGSVKRRDEVKVQSLDGYAVSVDVTIKYIIAENKAHKMYADTGSEVRYKEIVRNEAERACMGIFGQMKTEDFYNPIERRDKAKLIKANLSKSLEDNFIDIIDVLIRDVGFDPEYENKINRKKLADQEVELNKSVARAEEMRGKTQIIEAETQKKIWVIAKEKEAKLITMEAQAEREIAKIRADAAKYQTEKEADADLHQAQKWAKGEILTKTAEAEGERLRNDAMKGSGGSTMVALEAAKNLNLSDITISTLYIDLLDINAMATKLGVPEDK